MIQDDETHELSLSCLGNGPLLGPSSLLLLLFSIFILGRNLFFIGPVLLGRRILGRLGTITRLFVVGRFFLLVVVIAVVLAFAIGLFFGLLLLSCSLLGCFLPLLGLDGVPHSLQLDIRKSLLLLELIQLTATIVDLSSKLRIIGQNIIG